MARGKSWLTCIHVKSYIHKIAQDEILWPRRSVFVSVAPTLLSSLSASDSATAAGCAAGTVSPPKPHTDTNTIMAHKLTGLDFGLFEPRHHKKWKYFKGVSKTITFIKFHWRKRLNIKSCLGLVMFQVLTCFSAWLVAFSSLSFLFISVS